MPSVKAHSAAKRAGGAIKPSTKSSSKPAPPKRVQEKPLADWAMPDIWVEYGKTKSQTIRNFLMEKFLHLVRYNAERIHTRLPDEVDVDDLMQAGLFGLMDAINGFDLSRGVKFETFCAPRIRGAILDELRSMDWVPRLVRQRTAKVESARNAIEMATGDAATDAQIATRLGVDEEEFKKLQRDAGPVGVTSLSRKWFNSDSSRDLREIDVIRDDTQESPLSEAQRNDLKTLINKGLSRAERLIVILYYYEEMTMKEIGQTLDLSESRVSQMHSSILARLKAALHQRTPEFEPARG